ncbi:hypothetical protein GA0115240_114225 [Streptomyces sp. DvalAA-14]|uniref:hypothetical protein n=1 Tax=unclassified Streptomyces TaxID=2593676 RepID=UPI00081BB576|nr:MULTISPECIES: hypothetical protein [unclassified Streptomyces]SCD54891.1 hypothetical protein GA0115240_114225 [Streptomyces sp. DvalAA-14]
MARQPDRQPDRRAVTRLITRVAQRAPRPVSPAVPADARKDTLTLDGHRARVFNYARPAPDGRPAAYVEVHVTGRDGRPLLVRAWSVDGTSRDLTLLPEIVNSIEFTTGRLP